MQKSYLEEEVGKVHAKVQVMKTVQMQDLGRMMMIRVKERNSVVTI